MVFLVAAILLAGLDWYALSREKTRLGAITKPGVTAALLAFLLVTVELPSIRGGEEALLRWLALGLALSLVGDILLMRGRGQYLGGLIAFLLVQLAYMQAFKGFNPPAYAFWPGRILAVFVVVVSVRVYFRIAAAIASSGNNRLQILAGLYALAISGMLTAALIRLMDREWLFVWAYLAAGGALLLYMTSLLWAWNRFVRPIDAGRLKVRVSYHLGQIAIAVGATFHYLKYI